MSRLELDPLLVHEGFKGTEFGGKLAGNIRYGDKNISGLDNEYWRSLLGGDVNNLEHMPVTYGLARGFVGIMQESFPGLIEPDEKELILLAAMIHDEAESIIGDITYSKKTEQDEEDEYRAFEEYVSRFHPGETPETRDLILRAYEDVVRDKGSKLGRMFNAIEEIGYLRTALRAFGNKNDDSLPEEVRGSMHLLTIDVLLHQISNLTAYAREYPPVAYYLSYHSEKITRAFDSVDAQDFEYYEAELREKRATRFYGAHFDWMIWLSQRDRSF